MNTVPFEVIPLTETSYAVFREDLEKIIAHPEDFFFMVEDAESVIIRSVLAAMAQGGDAFGERIDGLSEYELSVMYSTVRDASDGLSVLAGVTEVRLEPAYYEERVRRYGLGTDLRAAFSGPDIPRVLSRAAGPELLGEPSPNDVVGYLVIESGED
jgi:hypothetical protein